MQQTSLNSPESESRIEERRTASHSGRCGSTSLTTRIKKAESSVDETFAMGVNDDETKLKYEWAAYDSPGLPEEAGYSQ
ncbi:hypothetical protein OAG48_00155 [bacterium]|nr:hypothetical protein [bacterium]